MIKLFFKFESIASVLFAIIIMIFPNLFGILMFGEALDGLGNIVIRLYGAVILPWASMHWYYSQKEQWALYRGAVITTIPGDFLTIAIIMFVLLQGILTWFNVAYLLMTTAGMILRLIFLYRPQATGFELPTGAEA